MTLARFPSSLEEAFLSARSFNPGFVVATWPGARERADRDTQGGYGTPPRRTITTLVPLKRRGASDAAHVGRATLCHVTWPRRSRGIGDVGDLRHPVRRVQRRERAQAFAHPDPLRDGPGAANGRPGCDPPLCPVPDRRAGRVWARQGISLGTTVLLVLGLVSIWFDDPTRLATALGLVTAGLAFALQKVDHRRGRLLRDPAGQDLQRRRPDHDGRRPRRRDRAGLHPDDDHGDGPAAAGRRTPTRRCGSAAAQYTGRVVTVTNDKIFDEPVYNYTRTSPTSGRRWRCRSVHGRPRAVAERYMRETAVHHTGQLAAQAAAALARLERIYSLQPTRPNPTSITARPGPAGADPPLRDRCPRRAGHQGRQCAAPSSPVSSRPASRSTRNRGRAGQGAARRASRRS